MERKYLLLKEDYSYFDYVDFMNIQQSMLKYYAETAQMLSVFSSFFKIVGFFFKTDDLYINYTKFDSKLVISSIIIMNFVIYRFYFKFFTYENLYFKNFVESLFMFFKILSFLSYVFLYIINYIYFFLYYFFFFLRFFFSSNRILIYHYSFILLFKLKKKSNVYVVIFDKLSKIFGYIRYIFIKFIVSIRYIKNVFLFFVNIFIDIYFLIKYVIFDMIFFFFYKVNFIYNILIIFLSFFFSIVNLNYLNSMYKIYN